MTINLESLPGLFAEIGQKADESELRPLVKALAGRCALFAGVVGKMAEHIATLEEKIEKNAAPSKTETKPDNSEEETEPANVEATADLDAEVMALAAKMNDGKPAEVVESAVQKGALT